MSQSPLKLFQVGHPKPVYLVSPVLSSENHNKGSCLYFLLTPSDATASLGVPREILGLLAPGEYKYDKFLLL